MEGGYQSMSSVDNRIVKMQMDNGQFTNAANATMNTLRKLGESLKLSEGAKGLENIASKAKNVNMDSLAAGVETVKAKFSALDIVGVTALVNITNSAINAGKNLVKSLTLDPITDGLREYETKMGSIQTILTNTKSKGTTLDDVNKALAELNEYSDKTIYNFAQMTDNIGKATAAGVGLEDAVIFVKGLANVAAGFGVDATAMAGATQQMTQALASGTIRLQDWMSMENRGMGGEMLQQALYETAEQMGVFVDRSVPFRYSLEKNWLSSEIFIETMRKMADNQDLVNAATKVKTFTQLIDTMKESVGSGWAVSWEHIFGDKEQSTEMFTAISNKFGEITGAMSDYRNEALKFWNEQGGRQAVLNGLKNILTSIGNVLGPIYNSFKKIIDPWNGERLVGLSKGFEKLTQGLRITDKTGELIGKTFDGLFSIFKLVGMVLKPIGALLSGITGAGTPLIDVFFKATSILTGWIAKVVEFIESSGAMTKAVNFMSFVGQSFSNTLQYIYENAVPLFLEGVGIAKQYINQFLEVMNGLVVSGKEKVDSVVAFVKAFNDAYQPLEKVKEFVIGIFQGIQNGIQSFMDFVKESVDTIRGFFDSIVNKVKDSDIQAIDFVNAGLFASLILVVKKLIPFLRKFFTAAGNFKDSVIGVLDSLQSTLESYQKSIKADIIKKIAIAIGILAASIFLLSKVDPERLAPAVTALGALIAGLMGAIWGFNKIDPNELKKTIPTVVALIGISAALNILASALVKLSTLKWEAILKGVVGLSAACLAVFALTKALDGAELTPKQGLALILMATSLYSLAGALAIIGNLDAGTIFQSLTTIGIVLTGLSLFFRSTKGINNSVKIAISLMPLTTSLLMLAGALAIFGNMNVDTLKQGFVVLAIALAELSAFTNTMRGFKGNMVTIGVGISILTSSLFMLSGVLGILGNMDMETLKQGLLSLATTLSILAVTLTVMPEDTIGVSTGLLILSGALLVMSIALKSMSNISWDTIGKGMIVLIGTLATLGVAALVMEPVTAVMLTLALAIGALGLACGVVGGALIVLATGLTMFSGAVVGGSLALVTALTAISSVIPIFAAAVALGLVSFLSVLGYNAGAIERALKQLITSLLNTLNYSIPQFVQVLTTLVTSILNALITMMPVVVDTLVVFLTQLLNALVAIIPSMVNTVVVFLTELMNAIVVVIPQLVETISTVIMSVLEALSTNLPIIAGYISDFLLNLLAEVLQSLADSIPKIGSSITDIIVNVINTIGNGVPRIVNAVFDLVINMINGLAEAVDTKMPQVRSAIGRLVKAIIEEFKSCVKDAVSVGGNIIDGLKNGISNGIERVKEAARNVASSALSAAKNFLGIHSPSRAFAEVGMYSDEGLAGGMLDNTSMVKNAAVSVAETALNSMQKAMISVNDFINSDMDTQPRIRPILDLSNVQNGVGKISSLLGDSASIKATVDMARKASQNTPVKASFDGIKDLLSGTTTNNNITDIKNEFFITSNDPYQVAEEVSTILQRQVERRDAIWE